MIFARKIWHILVGIKDGLALVLLLLFFWMLYVVLTARPNPGAVHEGALLLKLDGTVVEEPAKIDPLRMLVGGEVPAREFRERDLARVIERAATDDRIKVVVLDLDRFLGGGQVHMMRIGAALDKVRAAKKPVLTHALAYTDDAMLLAAHSTEVWVEPLGGAAVTGPGGHQLYYKGLLDKLKVKAHVYKVGTYKSAIEPFIRSDQSPEAAEALRAVYAALWDGYRADIARARPKANIALVTTDPAGWLAAAGGNTALAAQQAGLVDVIGDRVAFGDRVAKLVGAEPGGDPGSFRNTSLDPYLADMPSDNAGRAIGVVTIAGEIVDGDAGPGKAGGDRIAKLLDKALDDDLAALVVRVDSPGGSVLASEKIRAAITRFKARNIPVVVSMANLAASGGYWVSTPGTTIFAEPGTITGSIGIFGIIPTFEATLAQYGVTSDGIRTTPLSGQPDVLGGLTPEVESMVQAEIDNGYQRFITLVGQSRHKSPAQVDAIAQGRIWDGGTARQLGLVDRFGDLDDALAFAASAAKLGPDKWHADYLGQDDQLYQTLLVQLLRGDDDDAGSDGAALGFSGIAGAQQAALAQRLTRDLGMLLGGTGMQAYCLECPVGGGAAPAPVRDAGWLAGLARLTGLS
ncbi:signal peptide peptidase SppA [Novosphingobium tardum]|uniref:Signal peptide peptidase SppA n=1 Tax=Novosphingobium tardum TaxID=1538021 RepID=A0ABV8RNS5_9SPHN